MELDLARLFEVLDRHQVAYVLIGGLAAVYHGSPFPTEDVDITPQTDRANLARLVSALIELDARVRTESEPQGLPFAVDADSLAAAQTWNLTTTAGDLDLSFTPAGTGGYPDLRKDAVVAELYGASVPIASLADVVRSKQAANRPKDQRVLPTLREILARGSGEPGRSRDARRADTQRLSGELRNSLTEAEREQLGVAEKHLYDDGGLPA